MNESNEIKPRTPEATTRRRFLASVGRKAAYATPVLLTLAAQDARGVEAAPSASCQSTGSPCTVDADCCSNSCGTIMAMECD